MISGVATTKCAYMVATPNINCVCVACYISLSAADWACPCSLLLQTGRAWQTLQDVESS